MRVLVTGGAGYIGSVVVAHLLEAGDEVVVYDSLVKGHRDHLLPAAAFVLGDTGDLPTLVATLRDRHIDAVVHMAAFIQAGESMRAPSEYFRNNLGNGLTLLEAMRQTGVNRLVFSSTAAVYGNPRSVPIRESDPLEPTNAYGASKLALEQALPWYAHAYGLRYAALRYFNAAGAYTYQGQMLGESHEPETHLIPLVLRAAVGRLPHVAIFGTDYPTPDGTCIRDYIHVADLASAHVLALHALDEHSPMIYNLGNGRGFTVREVVAAAEQVTGRRISVVEGPRREGDPAVLVASSERISDELGWKPRHPNIAEIIASAWEWERSH